MPQQSHRKHDNHQNNLSYGTAECMMKSLCPFYTIFFYTIHSLTFGGGPCLEHVTCVCKTKKIMQKSIRHFWTADWKLFQSTKTSTLYRCASDELAVLVMPAQFEPALPNSGTYCITELGLDWQVGGTDELLFQTPSPRPVICPLFLRPTANVAWLNLQFLVKLQPMLVPTGFPRRWKIVLWM